MKQAAAILSPEGPPFPEPLGYLWAWYSQHCIGLAAGGMSHPVITWEGLRAWCVQMRIDLEPWEADVMMTLSCLKANVHAEQSKTK